MKLLRALLGCLTLTFLAQGLFAQTQHDRIRLNTGASITRQYTTGGSVTLGHLVKLNTSGQVIETSTTDTSGVIGVAINSAASGLVIDVGLIGEMQVTVDGGCTAANFLTISASIAGNARCLASPGTNQSLGASLTTLGSAGNITALFSAGNAGGGGGGGGSSNPTYSTLAFSATPVFNVVGTGPNSFKITLTGNVTSSTLTNAVAGQQLEFDICQDGTGGRTFVFPTNVLGAPTIFAGPNVCTRETFVFDGTNANFNAGGGTPAYTTVTFSATPTFTVSGNGANTFKITLTANVTSSTLTGAVAGQQIELDICQDGTGGRTFVFPTTVLGAPAISSVASACTRETFLFDGTNANFNVTAAQVSGTPVTNNCVKWAGANLLTDAGAACGTGGTAPSYTTVSFSATPTFTVSGSGPNGFKITLTGNVTSSTLSGAVAGQPLEFDICQDATGSRTFVFPANVLGAVPILSAASACIRETFMFDGTNANFNEAALLAADNTWTRPQRFKIGPIYDVTGFGASGSSQSQAITSGGSGTPSVVVDAVGDFAVGQGVYITNGGANNDVFCSTISTIVGTTITLADNIPSSAAGLNLSHDDQIAEQAAIDAATNANGGTVWWVGGLNFGNNCVPLHLHSGKVRLVGASMKGVTLQNDNNRSYGPGLVVTAPPTLGGYFSSLSVLPGSSPALLTGTGGAYNIQKNSQIFLDFRACSLGGTFACGDLNGVTSLTVEAEINLTNSPAFDQGILNSASKRDSLDGFKSAFSVTRLANGALQCKINVSTSGVVTIAGSAGAITTATNYHVAETYDGTNLRCFLNGIQVTSPAAATGTLVQGPLEQVTTGASRGGFYPDGQSGGSQFQDSLDGRIDAIRISAASSGTAGARYTVNFTPPTAKWSVPDSNTAIQCNFDNQADIFTVCKTGVLGGTFSVYIPFRNTGAMALQANDDLINGFTFGWRDGLYLNAGGENIGVRNITVNSAHQGLDLGGTVNYWTTLEHIKVSSGGLFGIRAGTGIQNWSHVSYVGNADVGIFGVTSSTYNDIFLSPTGGRVGMLVSGNGYSNISGLVGAVKIDTINADIESSVPNLTNILILDQAGPVTIINGDSLDCGSANATCVPIAIQGSAGNQSGVTIIGSALSAPGASAAAAVHVAAPLLTGPITIIGSQKTPTALPWVDAGNLVLVNGGVVTGANTVPYSATPVFDCLKGNFQYMTLTANVTSSTLINCTKAQPVYIELLQDATGGRTFVAPTNTVNFPTVASGANAQTMFIAVYDGAKAVGTVASGGGSGTPGGSNAQIQWNNNGAFAGSANVTYTLATGAVNVSQLANSNDFSRWKRFTDTAPTGFVHRVRNAADSADLYTLDVLGNTVANTGTFTDTTVAGGIGLSQGPTSTTAKCPALGPNCIIDQAPTTVTPHMYTRPGVPANGILRGNTSGSGTTLTETITYSPDRKTCMLVIGTDNGVALVNADLGPQGRQCFVSATSTLVEIMVAADAGTPNVIVSRNRAGTLSNFLSTALATAAAGGIACSNAGGTVGLDGVTTCSATLQNTGLNAGDWIDLLSGTAGGTAKRMSISVTWTVN